MTDALSEGDHPGPIRQAEPGVAVLGCGVWGINHVRAWSDLGLLRVVCDPDVERLELARSTCSVDTEFSVSISRALDRPDVVAVVVATPAFTHADIAIAALQAGKHVLVEKPLATSVEAAERIRSAAAAAGRILMVGHVLEFHPAVTRLREIIDRSELGELRYLYSHRLNFGRFRIEENALWSFAPHDVALLLRLLGGLPSSVSCDGATYVSKRVADVTLMSLVFPKDVRAHVFVSWLHPFKEHRFVAVGSDGMAVFDDTAPWTEKLIIYPHKVDWQNGTLPVARRADAERIEIPADEPLALECAEFVRCIETDTQPLTDGRSALDVLRVLEAAQLSMEQSGTPQAMSQ